MTEDEVRHLRADIIRLAGSMTDAECFRTARLVLNSRPWGNVRDMGQFLDSLTDLSDFNDCFGRGVKASDGDGLVDNDGIFLLLEHKLTYERRSFENGQLRLHKNWAAVGNTAITWWSNSHGVAGTTHMAVRGPDRDGAIVEAKADDVLRAVAHWWKATGS